MQLYKETYAPLLMEVITVPSPDCYEREPGESWARTLAAQVRDMEQALARHAHETRAVIVEPLVQCAGGMRMYDPVYLTLLREACDRYGVHLIADEIAVGFGRTGTLFACEQAGITPGFPVPVQGPDRRLPAAVGGAHRRSRSTQAFYDEYGSCSALPALAQLHRQSARLRRGAGDPRDLCATNRCCERNRALAAHLRRRAARRWPIIRTSPRCARPA